MKQAILVEDISKIYSNGTSALKNISFQLSYGKFVAIVGPNGAGKSSLIHIITKVLKPSQGKITITNIQPNKIAWVSQFTSIDWYLSALDNVRLGARLGGSTSSKAKTDSINALTTMGLKEKINAYPDELSGGEQKRMQVARALAQNPEILILDEPTTGLDPIACKKLMIKLKELTQRKCLVIIASHDLDLLQEYVDEIIFIDQGSLVMFKEVSNLELLIKDTYLSLYNSKDSNV